jgi:TonB family protein
MLKGSILISLVASLLAASGAEAAPPKGPAQDSSELVSRAIEKQYLGGEGTPPLVLHGEVRIWDHKGNVAKGEYTYNWVSASRWSEHIHFVNYDRIRVGDADGYWQKSDVDYEPQIIFELETLLNIKNVLKIQPKQTLGKVKSRQQNGLKEQCLEVKWPSVTEREMCFDESNGTLASVDYYTIPGQHQPEITRLEYGKFTAVGDKLVAHEVRAMRGSKMVASLNVLELSGSPETDAAAFNQPEGSSHWATCKEVEDRELVASDPPIYPAEAKSQLEQGRVIVYLVVEGDGSVSHLKLIQGATPMLDSVMLSSVKQWRYKPAACGQTPVRTEKSIPIDFWLVG